MAKNYTSLNELYNKYTKQDVFHALVGMAMHQTDEDFEQTVKLMANELKHAKLVRDYTQTGKVK